MHLIRPSDSSERLDPRPSTEINTSHTALPMAVWRWFAECLSEGEGQPLQRLALGALTRLLSSADPSSPDGGEVSVLLSSRAFLGPLFLALAHNHRKQATEGGLAGTEQWSLGVKEVMQDVGRGDTRELVSTQRRAFCKGVFKFIAYTVQSIRRLSMNHSGPEASCRPVSVVGLPLVCKLGLVDGLANGIRRSRSRGRARLQIFCVARAPLEAVA